MQIHYIYISTVVKLKLYTTLVRSHFAYCSPLWRPRYVRDISNIERVQRQATKYKVILYV